VSAAFAPDALDGQRALVTGGGRGIGEAIARQLASMGAEALIADLDGEAAARVAAEIVERGGQVTAQVLDLGDLDGLPAFLRRGRSHRRPREQRSTAARERPVHGHA
jgi:NAD(P)-dependent dehydrogenase (short-subunit alcohol dehydrogenase family)